MTEGSSRIDGFHRPPQRLPVYRPPADRKDSSICLEDESEQCVFRRPGIRMRANFIQKSVTELTVGLDNLHLLHSQAALFAHSEFLE